MSDSHLDRKSTREEDGDERRLISEILALLGKVTELLDQSEGNENWQWLADASAHNPRIVELLQEMTPTAAHVVDAVGRLEPVNGITISAEFRIPKGTVSKVTRRLIAQDLMVTESLPGNKKEVLFRLTPLGRELFEVHRSFDEQMERGFVRFLQRYSPDELRLLVRVLRDAAEASFITLGRLSPTSPE